MRKAVVVAVSLAMLASVSSCAGDDKENKQQSTAGASSVVTTSVSTAPVAAPTEKTKVETEGSVTVACSVQEDHCQAWMKAFTADTGIKANYVRLGSGEAVARMTASKSSPEFDVWHGGPSDGYGAAKKGGILEPYQSPAAAVIPVPYKDAESYWTGVYVGVLGFCSNKKVLDRLGVSVPDSWAALTDAKLRKQVSMSHPSTSGTAFTTMWTHVTLNGGDVEKTFAFFKTLHNNILQYSKSGIAPGQLAGRGEVAVGIMFSHDCVKYHKEGMTDLETSFPSEGTGYEVGGLALVKGAKHPNAAKAYIDWALLPRAQEVGATVNVFQVPTHPNAKVAEGAVNLNDVKLIDYDAVAGAAKKKELTTRFDEEIAAAPKE